ncbi:helix-turn-helix transcriptional regulator [Bosea sp. MMO-172]|uniref:helix-turn-helix transcriptional regulator n=1 Tax=Bosea sp. MMO-172 TaxID=3127885 RepID=UPI0030159D28
MPAPLLNVPRNYLRTPDAGRYLGLSGRTLEKHRTYGTGPAYHKLGGVVVYAIADLDGWAARGAVTSTSDPRGNSVSPARPQPHHTETAQPRHSR